MKISAEQVDQLYAFTRAHFVEYYDLQTELVDHLANAIEAQWQENPKLSFDEALKAAFKKFGIFGFSDVVDKRRGALSRKYHKLVWQHLKDFFSWPKILLTALAFSFFFFGLRLITYQIDAFLIGFSILTVVLYVKIIRDSYKVRRRPKVEKRWLFEEIIRGYGNVSGFMIVPMQIIGHFLDTEAVVFQNPVTLALASLALTLYTLFCYVILKEIPSKAEEFLRENYPEYRAQAL